MFDPMTITAAIGFSLSVLSFISTTLSTLIRQRDKIVRCRNVLNRYIYRLRDHLLYMKGWRYTWYGEHGFADELYIHCWGEAGYSEMKGRLMEIRDLTESLKAHLKLSNEHEQLSPTEYRQWSGIFENLEMEPDRTPTQPGSLERVAFALVNNAKIEEKLDQLKTLVEGIATCSGRLLRDQQKSNPEKNVTNEELRTLDNAFTLEKGLSKFATDLFKFHSDLNQVHEWNLELRLPDADGDAALPEIKDIATLSIDFLLQCKCLCKFDMARRFRVEYRTNNHSQGNDPPSLAGKSMIDQIRNCSSGPHFHEEFEFDIPYRSLEHPFYTQDRSLKTILREGEARGIMRKAFDHDRASIALALVNWVILLYNTPWTSAPCTCKIRPMQPQSLQERYVFVSELDTHSGPACFGEDLRNRKLVLLGTALAELALETSLTVSGGDEEVIFSKNDKRLSRAEILQDVLRLRGPIGITEAVRYCLNTSETPGDIRAERLREYAENILEPSVSCTSKLFLQLTLALAFEITSPSQKNIFAASPGEGSSFTKNNSDVRIRTIPSGNTHRLSISFTKNNPDVRVRTIPSGNTHSLSISFEEFATVSHQNKERMRMQIIQRKLFRRIHTTRIDSIGPFSPAK